MIISYSGYENITSKIHSGYISEAEDIDGLCNNLIKIYQMKNTDLEKMGQRGYNFVMKERTYNVLAKDYTTIF